MFETLLPSLPTLVATLAIMAGGLWVFRRSYVKQLGEMQEKVIATYKAQNEAQEVEIAGCKKEISRLKRALAAIEYVLKQRGERIEIDGEVVTLISETTEQKRTVQIRMIEKPENKDEK